MSGDDHGSFYPEPANLEPVDLEPGHQEPNLPERGDDGEREGRRNAGGARSRRLWPGLAVCGLAVWVVIALTTRHHHSRPVTTPPTTAVAEVERVDRVATASLALRTGLARIGVERFGAVIEDRLYVFGSGQPEPTLVRLPEGHAVISEQSGSSLLASTFEQTLVSTRPITTRTLSARDTAIRAVAPARWWLLRNDGTIRGDRPEAARTVPPGLRIVAATREGFVAGGSLGQVMWSKSGTRPIPTLGQFLTAGAHLIASTDGCGYSGCRLSIYDPTRGSTLSTGLSRVPAFASFSPDENRLAINSTQGDVYILDPTTGAIFARTQSIVLASQSRAFSWAPDGSALLVVQDRRIEILRASDGAAIGAIEGTDGVEQLAPLP